MITTTTWRGLCRATATTSAFARRRPIACSFATAAGGPGEAPEKAQTTEKAQITEKAQTSDAAENSNTARLSKPIKNFRDVMEAFDILVEEAEKKVEKRYWPNMFAEFKQLNDTEGKVVVGPRELVAVDKARVVPPLVVKSLEDKVADMAAIVTAGQPATLVVSSFKNYGLDMLPAWREPFEQAFAKDAVAVVTLNVIEDWYMKLVQPTIVRGLRAKIPESHHAASYTHFGRCDDFRTVMDLYNSFVGYAHLVDRKGRVRWIAGGPATPEELDNLFHVTRELLQQQKQSARRR